MPIIEKKLKTEAKTNQERLNKFKFHDPSCVRNNIYSFLDFVRKCVTINL